MQAFHFTSLAFERSRVTSVAGHERNFHVFYALLAGATAAERAEWKLQEPCKFSYLNKGSQSSDFDNVRLFKDLRSSFLVFGLSSATQAMLFALLAALLHLGNIEFVDSQHSHESAQIKNHDLLAHVAFLMGLDALVLQQALIFETRTSNDEACTIFLNAKQAGQRRDKIVQAIYYLLFSWILETINHQISFHPHASCSGVFGSPLVVHTEKVSIINILDVSGYEVLRNNGIYQFLVNYLNEKIHKVHLKEIVSRRNNYRNDGLAVAEAFDDDSKGDCLNFYEDRTSGAFKHIEDHCERFYAIDDPDTRFLESLSVANGQNDDGRSVFFSDEPLKFNLKHFFGVTQYECNGFVSSNIDELPPSVLSLILEGYGRKSCINSLLATLLKPTRERIGDALSGCINTRIHYEAKGIGSNTQIGDLLLAASAVSKKPTAFQGSAFPSSAPQQPICFNTSIFNCHRPSKTSIVCEQATSSLATKLFFEIDELLKVLLESSHLHFVICLRAVKSSGSRKADSVRFANLPDILDVRRWKPETILEKKGMSFDKSRLMFQLAAQYVLESLITFTSTPYPVHLSYSLLMKLAYAHSKLINDKVLFDLETEDGPIEDTTENRETLRDYLWLQAGLGAAVTVDEFYFGNSNIFMTCEAFTFIELIFRQVTTTRHSRRVNWATSSECREFAFNAVHLMPSNGESFEAVGPIDYQNVAEEQVEIGSPQLSSITEMQNAPELSTTTLLSKAYESNLKDNRPQTKSFQRRFWLLLTFLSTWWIPAFLLRICGISSPERQGAWREKFTLCILIFLLSGFLIFYIMGLTYILCPPQKIINGQDLLQKPLDQPNIIIRGNVYDLTKFFRSHNFGTSTPENILKLAGKDCSALFPTKRRCMLKVREKPWDDSEDSDEGFVGKAFAKRKQSPEEITVAASQDPSEDFDFEPEDAFVESSDVSSIDEEPEIRSPIMPGNRNVITRKQKELRDPGCVVDGLSYCHSEAFMFATLEKYWVGKFGVTMEDIARASTERNALIIINNSVYNVTSLIRHNATLTAWGQKTLVDPPWGVDKTAEYAASKIKLKDDMYCLEDYFIGFLDQRSSLRCLIADCILIGSTALVVAVMAFKFLAALQLGQARDPENLDKFVILQMPCYTEGEESLRKAIEALASLKYEDSRKLLFITADGMVVGSGNDRSTPRIVLDILGVDYHHHHHTSDPEAAFSFSSIGKGLARLNRGRVYTGVYESLGHKVPFIVIVKIGNVYERSLPGNRGKRDSQMILLRFLSKVHFDLPMNPLELEIFHAIHDVLQIDPAVYEYILMVDADTCVYADALNRMISCMLHDGKVMGICGETKIANETDSWITMIQIYEYYISHHLAKAFESLFGSVTCLPGCFCMYRIKSPAKGSPLLIDSRVLEDYSQCDVDTLHQKNLLSLGEDRYLTTLMLKYFPNHKISFTPDAKCCTTVPDRWTILLSQRRRWINSTIHNLWELLLLPQLCGCACFSMRSVVILDLFATLVMPATVGYLFYLIYQAFYFQMVPVISLCMLAAVYGMQIIVFLLKRQWQYIGWLLVHIIALPLYGLFIPLYSFWHFDDFSWGNTRRTTGDKSSLSRQQDTDPKLGEGEQLAEAEQLPLLRWSESMTTKRRLDKVHDEGEKAAVEHPLKHASSSHTPTNPSNHETIIDVAAFIAAEESSLPSSSSIAVENICHKGSQGRPLMDGDASSTNRKGPSSSKVAQIHETKLNPVEKRVASIIVPASHSQDCGSPARKDDTMTHDPSTMTRHPSVVSEDFKDVLAFPSNPELIGAIRRILASAELSAMTRDAIKDKLTQEFGPNMKVASKKDFLDSLIDLLLTSDV